MCWAPDAFLLLKHREFNPISPLGFLVALAGASVVLIAYRLVLVAVAIRREREEDELEDD